MKLRSLRRVFGLRVVRIAPLAAACAWIYFAPPARRAWAVSHCGPHGVSNAQGKCDCTAPWVSNGPPGAATCVCPSCAVNTGGGGALPMDAGASVAIKGATYAEGSNDSADNNYTTQVIAGPQHKVTVGDYKIDKYEVSVSEYTKCVKANQCKAPPPDQYERCNYGVKGLDAHPMNCVSWQEATDYCNWKGKRLPTEAEWEYAAKGPKDNVYPWGSTPATCKYANFSYSASTTTPFKPTAGCGEGTSAIGSHPLGNSPFGVHDLGGNVEEWTQDWYATFNGLSPTSANPGGPSKQIPLKQSDGSYKYYARTLMTVKGGSWDLGRIEDMHTVRREGVDPSSRRGWLGFRCAQGPAPITSDEMFTLPALRPPPPPPPAPPAPKVPPPGDLGAMIKIAAGSFQMGDQNDDAARPAHMVSLAAFSIDKYEVTVGQYKQCVDKGACAPPLKLTLDNKQCNWEFPDRENHPVNCVEWSDAKHYCDFAGKRLPTEAEWEFAARGPTARIYPWGDDDATCEIAAFKPSDSTKSGCASSTQVVGTHPKGASYFGVMDMGGNVEEFVLDWYGAYSADPQNNPTGPSAPDENNDHIARGGDWGYDESVLKATFRWRVTMADDWIGFRCVKSGG